MGNHITTPDGTLKYSFTNKNSNNLLVSFIYDWALNNYTEPTLDGSNLGTNILKKRACCTRKEKIPIELPYIDSSNNIQTMSVIIPVFEKPPTKDDCSIKIENNDSKEFYYNIIENRASHECQDFYPKFCSNILKIRKLNNNNGYYNEKIYGPNINKSDLTNLNQNPFLDV